MGNVMFMRKGEVHTKPIGVPELPSSYNLIETITQSTTFVAPTTGYYKVEDIGASGNGGVGKYSKTGNTSNDTVNAASGGGGGGSGFASSIVQLNEGDLILIVIGDVGSDTTVTFNPTTNNTYEVMRVTSGANGGVPATANQIAVGGEGGIASGGNLTNANGNKGGDGAKKLTYYGTVIDVVGGAGGTAATHDGNVGGAGATVSTFNSNTVNTNGTGKAGFVRIYAGDTNVA